MILPKIRAPRFITIRRGGTLTDEDHRLLVVWAAECASHVLHYFEDMRPDDDRPRRAIEAAHAWVRRLTQSGRLWRLRIKTNERLFGNRSALTGDLEGNQFCVEMETGTGKTYVYTKTIYELNRQYGFSKFIIVVPSVAIHEGVHKSFEITAEHFAALYDNVPCRFFIYNSVKLSAVRNFAVSTDIEVMIINIDAFKKSENI